MGRDIHLTDKQYHDLLLKIHETVNKPGFMLSGHDSTETGNKYTETNCGLCNDEFTTKETALFPDEFPGRKSMKYRQSHHKCPFDMRSDEEMDGNGCFYTCIVFQKKRGRLKPDRVVSLVNKMVVEKGLI